MMGNQQKKWLPSLLKARTKRYIFTVLAANIMYPSSAFSSNTIYPLVTYKCNPGADTITLTNSILNSDDGGAYHYSDVEGTYSPWNMVEIEQKTNHSRIVRTKKIVKTCQLSSGEYTVTLEPQVFSRDLNSKCGTSISSAITIRYDGIDIQERTPFEDYCRGNAPIVTHVTVFGRTSEVIMKRTPRYKFY